ncbi:hypothetical protein [Streptomyces sp. AV19]|uniref:hypothetical protein n=1 Tax=Streptomyces sp. AV19 TaxID=2793068 RepID=UPI001F30B27F|nr:hypothetical protein [Streptomyces sp. AV19]MDG4531657.1 hypothetical protein [Streptomyces sp. AV19]
MPWVRFDDRFPSNRKIRLLSDGAFRLYVSAICWSAENLTDGVVKTKELRLVADVKSASRRAQELVDAGLWMPIPGTGWRIHDYHEYQPAAEQVRADREAKTARQKRWRDKKRSDDAPQDEADVDASTAPSHDAPGDAAPRTRVPGPTRPDPTRTSRGADVCAPRTGSTSRATTAHTPVPADFQPNAASLAWAERDGHLARLGGHDALNAVTAAFIDWHTAKDTRAADPNALWRKWVREQRTAPAASDTTVLPFPGIRRSTTDDRVTQALAVAAELRALEEGNPA